MDKIKFWDTEVLRFANSNMRMMQFLEAKTSIENTLEAHNRTQISVYELMLALHAWKRQLQIARGLIKTLPSQEKDAGGMLHTELSHKQFVQQIILMNPRSSNEVNTGQARDWVRHRLRGRGVNDAAAVLKDALQELLEVGLIVVPHETTQKPGRKVAKFTKNGWKEIKEKPAALTLLHTLGLGEDQFNR